ncbi:hypothetical protein AABM38_13660 [Heyndrickxia sp. MSNUG]|uniref:hypothetical protein n=1 Tax=Heyndrickxia sp. MSNUG TaxID=3136677 RepID=UPI003C30C91F
MEEVLMSTDHYIFTTTTAEVMPPNDFVVEFITDLQDMNKKDSVIRINNLDELLDFLEQTDW